MRNTPIFPLAKLVPVAVLAALAAVAALVINRTAVLRPEFTALGILPLFAYLGWCHWRARRMLLVETGREKDILKASFIAMVAERSARFWGFLFSVTALAGCSAAMVVWVYQCFLWYQNSHWSALSWLTVVQKLPQTDVPLLQQSLYWLADTNIGVLILISGLLLAAPLAAISWRSNNKAKFRRNDLANLKKRS